MRIELEPAQRLLLWRLIAEGGLCWQKHLHPAPRPSLRGPLESARLIRVSSQGREGNRIEVTDRGWAWAEENFGGEFSAGGPMMAETLQLVLEAMGDCLRNRDIALFEVFGAERGIEESIKRAYKELSKGKRSVRVRLSELREFLKRPKDVVDSALGKMMQSKQLTLFRLDDPKEVKAADREAAYRTPSGTELHLVYLGGAPS